LDIIVFIINKAVITGLVIGSVYALGAVGVTLIAGILRFSHFAHGDVMTMGGFISFILAAFFAGLGLHWPIASGIVVLPVSMAATALVLYGFDIAFYAPLRRRGARPITLLIASIGVTMMLQGVLRLFAGTQSYSFFQNEPKLLYRIDLGWLGATRPLTMTQPQAFMIGLTLICCVALALFLNRSRLGKAMRAMSDNPSLAQVSGINTQLVVRVTWLISGALACLAGTMLALDVQLKPDLAFNIILPIFAAAVVGGLGQPYGAIAGGFLVGFAETLAVFDWSVVTKPLNAYLPDFIVSAPNLALVPTEYKLVVSFVILVVVLLSRPTGIFKGVST
jgi:branched-chain amino acid transport system permease protein